MTLHYHGTPITPREVLYDLAGHNFCVSYAAPQDVKICHEIGQMVMLDNGAFSVWTKGAQPDWRGYYGWVDQWLDCPTTWAVIPDVINGTELQNDWLLHDWPHGDRGVPVWHISESFERLARLLHRYGKVCFGSSGDYKIVGDERWHQRMTDIFNWIERRYTRTPWIHMLRGMSLAGGIYPFASLDSTDAARNHNRKQNTAAKIAKRWDALQCAQRWHERPEQIGMAV